MTYKENARFFIFLLQCVKKLCIRKTSTANKPKDKKPKEKPSKWQGINKPMKQAEFMQLDSGRKP